MNRAKKEISVIIPAFQEERNIVAAVENVIGAVGPSAAGYEIIVVNDGSSDQTGPLAEHLARKYAGVKVLHNESNRGFGYSYRRGLEAATKEYVTVFPGDNDMSATTLTRLIQEMEGVDLVVSYLVNTHRRSWFRRILSRIFVWLLNTMFGLHLKYFNGAFLVKLDLVRGLSLKSNGLTAPAECLVKLIKSGCRYKEIAFEHTGRLHEKSKALTWRSLKVTILFFLHLIKDIYFTQPSVHKRSTPCSI